MTVNTQLIKQTGATFTPPQLADFIADKLLSYLEKKEQKYTVLDPACGEGILLSSISKKLLKKELEFKLVGFDSNKDFLEIAAQNLQSSTSNSAIDLHHGDFLQYIQPQKQQTSLFETADSSDSINNSIDLIIANPPYVRTQILGADYAQEIAKKFNLKGRVDLYYPFLLGMTYALKENGLIGVITSNRYLSTKSGASVRKFLKEHYDILQIIDLGDTKLFDAAVLPAIFIGRKKSIPSKKMPQFTKVYEELNGYKGVLNSANTIYEILNNKDDGFFSIENKKYKKTSGIIQFVEAKEAMWALLSKEEDKWINKIQEASKNTIGDFFKVRVGIKTTADKVFIRDDWESQDNQPEGSLLKDLISQQNIEPWTLCTKKKLKVVYPHYSENGKKHTIDLEKYPKTKSYFEEHKEQLSNRKYLIKAGRKWFEIWVAQNPALWEKPKLVFPDISPYPRFYFDESKQVVNGNCYWIVAEKPEDVDLLLLVQGIANSKLMTKYHDLMFNNKLYSGRRRYFSQYVEKYPLPDAHSKSSKKIVSIVKVLNSSPLKDKTVLVEKLEVAVASAFGVEPVLSLG